MILLGDIHADYELAFSVAQRNPQHKVIQIGDFGFGFRKIPKNWPTNLFFIRGNHDHPQMCQNHPNYLGEFGIVDDVFFVSGAASIDVADRIEGFSWWPDEQLSYAQLSDALDLYDKTRPKIVISHDAPQDIVRSWFKITDTSATRQALNAMLHVHRPHHWYFGHHHREMTKDGFTCVDINQALVLDF